MFRLLHCASFKTVCALTLRVSISCPALMLNAGSPSPSLFLSICFCLIFKRRLSFLVSPFSSTIA